MLLFGFNIPVKGRGVNDAMESVKPLMSLVFYCMEKVKRFKLSKEAKTRADKNRARVEEAFLKNTHAARAEAAALRREEKRRQEKERILQVQTYVKYSLFIFDKVIPLHLLFLLYFIGVASFD